MKTKLYIPVVLSILLSFATISCEKESFERGQYFYENQELIRTEHGLMIEWGSDTLSDDIKEVVREIVTSMVFVNHGSFIMGAGSSTSFPDESPLHEVNLSDYYVAKVLVTQRQWAAIMGNNPLWSDNYGKGDDYPANFISYEQAKKFIDLLSEYSGLSFRMPTEAEWEYAACGGTFSHGYLYGGSNVADLVAWHRDNANGTMHPVAMLDPNELGLYDMSGNVWEWCSDWYGSYSAESVTDPIGPATGTKRVVRGGSFTYEPVYSRCKARNSLLPTNQSLAVGLRLAISANETK